MDTQIKNKSAKITYANGGMVQTVDLYSREGLDLISLLWTKLYAQYKLHYETKWMGIPIIQFTEDILMMQELIWKIKPDVIIECGIAHGGSLIFYASLFELMGQGKVIGVDIDIREHNRIAIENHPMKHRIELLEGSSTSDEIVAALKERIAGAKTVLIVLDSNHSAAHVAKEIELFHDMVTPGSYLVVMDGAQAYVADIPDAKPGWEQDNPLIAIEEFVAKNDRFEVDPYYNRLKVTSNPNGFLRRVK